MATAVEVLSLATALPESDRALIARELILTLERGSPDEGYEAAWSEELERRMASYERGESNAVEWRAALKQMRAELDARSRK